MYWRLIISLEETIQVWIISSKDINLQYLCKVYCRDLGQYLMQFDALEKCVMRLQLTAFKYCNDWTPGQYRKTNEDRKFIIWINAHIPIEKQSNQGWNTSIHLKHNAPHMKVPLIFWFLIMISYLCFYHQLWVKWVYIHIGNSCGQTHSRFAKNLSMFDTCHVMSSTFPPERKKQYCI